VKTFFKKLLSSFDNSPGGFSARKLSAFTAVMAVSVIITHRYTTPENLRDILIVWLTFALLCLGIITAEQVIRFREGKENKPTAQTETESPQ
jgi:hypothetical protein